MNNTDAKQSAGYFKEKAIIGLSTFTGDEIVKAILKVTSHLLKAPKEKHMQKLVAASYGQYGSGMKEGLPINEFIVRELEKRSHTHNWIVVLKTMVSFHRLLCDASDSMVETICYLKNVFNHSNIKNISNTADGAGQAYFIAQYMTYLEERCVMQSALEKGRRIEIPEFEDYLKTLNADTLQPVFEILLRMLEALSAVEFREGIVNNFCTMEAYQLLVRDGKRLFQHLAKRVIFVLDGFEEFTLPEKRRWFDLYRRYDSAFVSLKRLFDSMLRSSRVFVEPVPQLKPLPESLVTRLASDIRASEMPKEEPCTLESLGIRSTEDARVPEKEEKIHPPPVPKPAAAKQPETTTTRTPAAPTFSMDDLFVSSPEPPRPVQPNLSPASWTSSPPPAAAFQSGPPESQWATGAPADWSTGAPQSWGSGAPGTFQQSPSPPPSQQQQQQFEQKQPFFGAASPATATAGAPYMTAPPSSGPAPPRPTQSKKPVDPFKDLYDRSQLDFS
ncbi:clathrin coat assembly protein [Novymonas esmeraldas]|uniref:Clathrin coat assembly protein n=1 Tax=Novymonas esmeraldas TaxID=1808958 RepID=A0AAW0F0R9_9TRYP